MQATKWRFIPGVLALALCAAPAAMAATSSSGGVTSGPAAGTNAVPNTAVEKHASNGNAPAATGDAGVAGKRGVESGAVPNKSSGSNTNH